MKVLHLLASNKYSGAENVACQIIQMFEGEIEMAYCSPNGPISDTLKNKKIEYIPINKLSIKEVMKAIKQYRPNIIHCHDLKAIAIASMIKHEQKIAHIHVNHPKMKKFSLRAMVAKLCLGKFKHVFWVSESCFDDYKYHEKLKNKSTILPNIISIKNLHNSLTKKYEKKNYDMVYCGRLTYQKNPLRILDIVSQLVAMKNNLKVVICGNGEMFDTFKNEIISKKLDKTIDVKGFVNNPADYISQSKLMILTSFFEGTPMTALESIALGVPVISTRTDGMKNLIHNGTNGYLYDSNEEAVNIIINLLNNTKRLLELKETSIASSNIYNDIDVYKKKLLVGYNNK